MAYKGKHVSRKPPRGSVPAVKPQNPWLTEAVESDVGFALDISADDGDLEEAAYAPAEAMPSPESDGSNNSEPSAPPDGYHLARGVGFHEFGKEDDTEGYDEDGEDEDDELDDGYSDDKADGRVKMALWHKIVIAVSAVVIVLCLIWAIFIYSPTPRITALRNWYIETAMTTFKHQWLAKNFIPANVVNAVVSQNESAERDNIIDVSAPPPSSLLDLLDSNPDFDPAPSTGSAANSGNSGNSVSSGGNTETDNHGSAATPVSTGGNGDKSTPQVGGNASDPFERPDVSRFLRLYYQIDRNTLPDEFFSWNLSALKLKDIEGLGIKTTSGDPVWAIDTVNGILIVSVSNRTSGYWYEGKLAIVKDSSQVFMGSVPDGTDYGYTVRRFTQRNNAILGINANPFYDANAEGESGKGTGNMEHAMGLIISNGVVRHDLYGGEQYQVGGFDWNNNFLVGSKLDISVLRDAGEFKPVIIANGSSFSKYAWGNGVHPRSVIGQTNLRETLLLVLEGRVNNDPFSGATVSECADILLRYNCWNALHNDGGSSAVMVYDGEVITNPSSVSDEGRNLPCAWLVRSKK